MSVRYAPADVAKSHEVQLLRELGFDRVVGTPRPDHLRVFINGTCALAAPSLDKHAASVGVYRRGGVGLDPERDIDLKRRVITARMGDEWAPLLEAIKEAEGG